MTTFCHYIMFRSQSVERAILNPPAFAPAVLRPSRLRKPLCFTMRGEEILSENDSGGEPWRPPEISSCEALPIEAEHYLGRLHGSDCLMRLLPDGIEPPQGMNFLSLYHLLARCDDATLAMAGSAAQIARWDRDHRYCGRCAEPTRQLEEGERARRCDDCELDFYPRLSPCIIVIVRRGAEMLLANGIRHPDGLYSALAGFIEPGETIEACARREIAEEVGIEIHEPNYFGSQPWPFPHQLMLGLIADYRRGEINPDPKEIKDARWWHHQELPEVPGEFSIAGRMIQALKKEMSD